MRWVPVLLSLALGGCIPERDNPYDPASSSPRARILEPYAFSCQQWYSPEDHPLPVGFSKDDLDSEEFAQVDAFCYGNCVVDIGLETCQLSYVITSALERDPPRTCTSVDRDLVVRYREILEVRDRQRVAALVVPARPGTVPRIEAPEDGGLHILEPTQQAVATVFETALLTDAAARRFDGQTLLTRSLHQVERSRATLNFTAGSAANQIECIVEVHYDQAHDVVNHPQGFGGGYGRHVAIADLVLEATEGSGGSGEGAEEETDERGAAHASRLEFATTFAGAESRCWVDVAYRDANTRLQQIGYALPDFEAECLPDGSPPPLASGRFLSGGAEAFAVVHGDRGMRYLDFLGAVGAPGDYQIGLAAYVAIDLDGAPDCLAGVGNVLGSSADDVAIVPPGGALLMICTASGGCLYQSPPDCRGAPARFVEVAPLPPEVPTSDLLAAVQSSAGTCVVRYSTGGALTVVEQREFPGVPSEVAVHWATAGGQPVWVVVGELDPAEPAVLVREYGGSGVETYGAFYSPDGCEPILVGDGSGVGAAAVSQPDYECATDGSGCQLFSYRAVGLPRVDVFHLLGVGDVVTVVDEGAIGFLGETGCGLGFFAQGSPIEGLTPTSMGQSLAARADPARAREVTSAVCEVGPTTVLGAPADTPLGGTGRMFILYETGAASRTQPYCEPLGLP